MKLEMFEEEKYVRIGEIRCATIYIYIFLPFEHAN